MWLHIKSYNLPPTLSLHAHMHSSPCPSPQSPSPADNGVDVCLVDNPRSTSIHVDLNRVRQCPKDTGVNPESDDVDTPDLASFLDNAVRGSAVLSYQRTVSSSGGKVPPKPIQY